MWEDGKKAVSILKINSVSTSLWPVIGSDSMTAESAWYNLAAR